MTCGVYEIECVPTGWAYVGSSVNIESRWHNHRSTLRHGKHPNQHLQRAWTKYGESKFRFRIVVETIREARRVAEAIAMRGYDVARLFNQMAPHPTVPKLAHSPATVRKMIQSHQGFTLPPEARARVTAANRGRVHTAEARANMRAAKLGRSNGPHSEETKHKIADGNRGKRMSAESRQRMSDAKRGRPGRLWSDEMRQQISQKLRGHPVSEESRAKMRAAKLGRPHAHSPETIQKFSEAQRGKPRAPHTAETRAKIQAASLARWQRRRETEAG